MSRCPDWWLQKHAQVKLFPKLRIQRLRFPDPIPNPSSPKIPYLSSYGSDRQDLDPGLPSDLTPEDVPCPSSPSHASFHITI